MDQCQACGTKVEGDWAFCRNCGRILHGDESSVVSVLPIATEAEPLAPKSGSNRKRSPWMWVALFAAVVLVAGSAGVAFSLNGQLKDSRALQLETQSELETTHADLETTGADLSDTQVSLEAMTDERDHLTRRNGALKTTLKGLQTSLSDVQSQVQLQAGQIDVLKTCLDGVSSALTYVAYSQYNAAINALNAVDAECQTAYSLF